MELRHIALGNLRRRRGKAALITAGLTVAVAAFVLVLSLILSLRATMDDKLTKYGSNLVVTPQTSELNLSYGGMSVAGAGSGEVKLLAEQDLEELRQVPSAARISAVVPVLLQPVEVQGRSFLAMGTDMAESLKVKLWWRLEGNAPRSPEEILVGLNVRNELGLEAGDRISLQGRSFTISGLLWETGGEEDNLIIVDRLALAELTDHRGQLNLIEVTAANGEDVAPLTAEIEAALPGATVSSVKKSIEFTNQANSALADFGLALTMLIMAICGMVVTITMLSAVKERQKEIGIFRAVGYKQRHIAQLVLLESAMLSASAGAVGVVLGLAAALLAPRFLPELSLGFVFSPLVVLAGVAAAFVVGLLSALYPARRAANLDPATSLKYV